MSKTIADFPVEDANLYFRGTYCMDLTDNEPVHIRDIGRDVVYVTRHNGNEEEVDANTICQWWPETRGTNIVLGRSVAGVLLTRLARRQSRRSICSMTANIVRIGNERGPGYRRQLDLGTARMLHKREMYVDLSREALLEYIAKWDKEGKRIESVCLGRRLFYKPLWNHMVGRLYYSHLGVVGVMDLNTGSYKPISTQSRISKRAAHSLEKFLC